jgi:hypothetical protein
MDLLTIGELMHLTRDALCDLSQRIEQTIPKLGTGTVARANALVSLENIKRVMLMRGLHF